jgi:hypothetical protein
VAAPEWLDGVIEDAKAILDTPQGKAIVADAWRSAFGSAGAMIPAATRGRIVMNLYGTVGYALMLALAAERTKLPVGELAIILNREGERAEKRNEIAEMQVVVKNPNR